MEYRQLPHGGETEKFSVLGLGTGGLHQSSDEEIEAVVRTAIQNGINFFDLCAGGSSVYAPFGRAIAGTATGAARSTPRKAPVCRRSPRIFKMQNNGME